MTEVMEAIENITVAFKDAIMVGVPMQRHETGKPVRYGYSTYNAFGESEFTLCTDLVERKDEALWLRRKQREMGEEGKNFVIAGNELVRITALQAAKFSVDATGRVCARIEVDSSKGKFGGMYIYFN